MPPEDESRDLPITARHNAFRAAAVGIFLTAIFYSSALPVIFQNRGTSSRAAADQRDWHLPVIRQFLAQWPHPDLSDYASSTTPGYHLIVAAIGHLTRTDTTTLRLIGSLFTAGLLMTLGLAVGLRSTFTEAIALCLPVLTSVYVFSSGTFLLPENAGWWGVLCILLIATGHRFDGRTYALVAVALLALVLVRQSHLWVAAPLLVAAYVYDDSQLHSAHRVGSGSRAICRATPETDLPPIAHDPFHRLAFLLPAFVPALFAVAWFHHLWHGNLVPPNQIALTAGGNVTAPAVILAIIGMACPFYCGFLPRGKTGRWREVTSIHRAAPSAIVGGVIAAIPRSTYDIQARRYSGIWNLVNHIPYYFHRSPLLIALAALGGAALAIWFGALPLRQRLIWATALVAFTAFQMISANPWQRYYEPLILMTAALTAPVMARRENGQPARWAPLGPLLLAFLCAAVTVIALAAKS